MNIRQIQRSEDGFTLVELLVATTLALIVFAVTLSVLNVFSDTSRALTHQNDSQNQARLDIEEIVSQLRNASPPKATAVVERANPYDLVFQTIGPSDSSKIEQMRYCVPPAAGAAGSLIEPLYAQTQTTPTSAVPWSSSACPDTRYGSSMLVGDVTNVQRGASVFTYNGGTAPIDLTAVKSVGIDLLLDPTPADTSSEYQLRSSAWLRNAKYPVATFTSTEGATSGTVDLDASASYSPSGDSLSYAWSCLNAAGSSVDCSSSASTFAWKPGSAGTYDVKLTVTDQAGAQASVTQQVTVT